GVYPEDVHVVSGDTSLTPVDLGSYSSRVTMMAGNATKNAGLKLREQLVTVAAEKLGIPADRVNLAYRNVYDLKDPGRSISFVEAANLAEAKYGTLVGAGSYKPPAGIGGNYNGAGDGPTPTYHYQVALDEVAVGLEAGQHHLDKRPTGNHA